MKKITLWSFALTIALGLTGQPNYQIQSYSIKPGEKGKFYVKRASNQVDKGRTNRALYNAAFGLKVADKKGDISDAQKIIGLYFQSSMDYTLEQIRQLESRNQTFQGDQTVTDRAEILNMYTVMDKYNDVLATLPQDKFKPVKKKDAAVVIVTKDFNAEIAEAQVALDKSIEEAATWHYDKGRELQAKSTDNKENAKEAAKRYRYATAYVTNYRDADDRYEVCKKLGTTRLGLTEFKSNSSSDYGNLGANVSNELLSLLMSSSDKFEFFEVVDRESMGAILEEQKLVMSGLMDESTTASLGEIQGVDALLVGEVVKGAVEREEGDGGQREHKKKVKTGTKTVTKDDGTTKEEAVYENVTAYTYWRWKKQVATVKVAYKIIDVSTGKVIAVDDLASSDRWEDEWATGTRGDKRALPSVKTVEPSYPGRDNQIVKASNDVAKKIYGAVASYAKQVSK